MTQNSKAKTRCYIYNNRTKSKRYFQFNPTTMPYSREANFSSIESPGMNYPLTQFVSGGAREFTFDVYYHDRPYSGKITATRRFLELLLPPEVNGYKLSSGKYFTKPPTFILAYGYFVKTYVLKRLEVKDEILNEDGLPIEVTFSLTVRQVSK